jgi:hypothetical protein
MSGTDRLKSKSTWLPGSNEILPKWGRDLIHAGINNVAIGHQTPDDNGFFHEGGPISKFFNLVAGVNSGAGLHDPLAGRLMQFGPGLLMNQATLLPTIIFEQKLLLAKPEDGLNGSWGG